MAAGPPWEDNIVERYRGVAKLAQAGSDGEKANAEKIASAMRAKYPGVESQRLSSEKEKEKESKSGFKPSAHSKQEWKDTPDWKDVAADTVSELLKELKKRHAESKTPDRDDILQEVAELVEIEVAGNTRSLTLKIRIPVALMDKATEKFGEKAIIPYAQAIGDAIASEIVAEWTDALDYGAA
jgi:hypothetical protein